MAWYDTPLQVVGFLATRRGDEDRGPAIRMRSEDALKRQLADGDLAWVNGPRRQEIARVMLDDSLPRGGVVLRDIAGIAASEIVRVSKPESNRPHRPA